MLASTYACHRSIIYCSKCLVEWRLILIPPEINCGSKAKKRDPKWNESLADCVGKVSGQILSLNYPNIQKDASTNLYLKQKQQN